MGFMWESNFFVEAVGMEKGLPNWVDRYGSVGTSYVREKNYCQMSWVFGELHKNMDPERMPKKSVWTSMVKTYDVDVEILVKY